MPVPDLAYPIGPFVAPAHMDAGVRARHVATLAALPMAVRAAVEGLGDAQLDTPYRPDGWLRSARVTHRPTPSVANVAS